MRIISGKCKGRKLSTLKGMNIRPTSDRVRESIFNIIGDIVNEADVLDLFAGTGAFGIECLSRGANRAVFVDVARSSCAVIRQNIEICGFKAESSVFQCDAAKLHLPSEITSAKFNLIFMDPPYEKGFVETILKNSSLIQCLKYETTDMIYDSLMIVEHSFKEKIPDTLEKLDIHDQRQYGNTLISFLKYIG